MDYTEVRHIVNGVDTAVLTAGDGESVMFLHGGGTATGFDALLPLAKRCRLVVPIHPGFGASADDPAIDDIQDYVLHYLDLFDRLELDEIRLAGHSFGGFLAARIALYQPSRIRRLVLAAPFGMTLPGHETVSLQGLSPETVADLLTDHPSVAFARLPDPPTRAFLDEREREARSAQRVLRGRTADVRLARWLHRLTMPTLLLWGADDRLIPAAQAAAWAGHLPRAETRVLPGVSHLLFDESRNAVDTVGDFLLAGG